MLGENEFLYDYEKYPLGYVVPDLENKNVEIVKGEKHHGFLNFREAEAWARKNIIRVYYDEETGGKGKICIGRKTINKYLTSSAVEKSDNIDVHLSVLKILPQVIMKSIEVEIHPDFIKKGNTRKPEHGINYESIIHRLFGAAHIGNDLYRVKITLIEYYDRNTAMKPHSYEATKVELLDGTLNNAPMGTVPRSSSSIPAAKLLKNVEMSYAKGKYFF